MSSPNSEPDGKKEPDGKMDPADFIQLRQFITFPRSNTTWSISSRRSCYPKDGEIASNSFVEPALFNVVIGGIGHKSMPSGIPRTAILKVQSLSVSTPPLSSLCGPCQFLMDECVQSLKDRIHTITKHNKDKTFDRKSLITSSTREEFVAMNQLTLNECSSTPRLVDHKVVLHDEMPGKEIYVSFILMTECPGLPLKQEIFWRLPQAERDLVRKAFRRALSEIHACWIVLEQYESKDLIWNARENKV
jgi:hypothetical protein